MTAAKIKAEGRRGIIAPDAAQKLLAYVKNGPMTKAAIKAAFEADGVTLGASSLATLLTMAIKAGFIVKTGVTKAARYQLPPPKPRTLARYRDKMAAQAV